MDKLYYVVLVVELQPGQDGKGVVPFISYKYPSQFEEDPYSKSVTQFCFPDINQFPTEFMPRETFSFVLTEGDGERRFGYCLRKLPPGTGSRYPVAFSIMTYFPCFQLFTKILDRMAYNYENVSMSELTNFVSSLWEQKIPEPGETFSVAMQGQGPNSFKRPDESGSPLEHFDLDSLLTYVEEKHIMILFASLVIERRIIFCSSALSTLSACIQTAMALLYPLSWQHIYIPVLPKSLLTFVCAPMPFVVGVLKTELDEVLALPMDEVLIIDLDNDSFIRIPGQTPTDDLDLLPLHYTENIRKHIKLTQRQLKRINRRKGKHTDELEDNQLNYELKKMKKDLTDSFVDFFVKILGNYRSFLLPNSFDKDGFLASHPEDVRKFVDLMTGAQMFERFAEEGQKGRCQGFDKRVLEGEIKLPDDYQKLLESEITNKRPPAKKPGSSFSWSTLRNKVKRDATTENTDSIVFGSPTLIMSSTDRQGKEVKPNVPTKPSLPPIPKFVVPAKALPTAPGSSSSSSSATSNSTPTINHSSSTPATTTNATMAFAKPRPPASSGGHHPISKSTGSGMHHANSFLNAPAPTPNSLSNSGHLDDPRSRRQSVQITSANYSSSSASSSLNSSRGAGGRVVIGSAGAGAGGGGPVSPTPPGRGRGMGRGGVRPMSVRPGSIQPQQVAGAGGLQKDHFQSTDEISRRTGRPKLDGSTSNASHQPQFKQRRPLPIPGQPGRSATVD